MTIVNVLVKVVPFVPVAAVAEKGVAATVWVPAPSWGQGKKDPPRSPHRAYGAPDSTWKLAVLP
jgi:hypothetical protein